MKRHLKSLYDFIAQLMPTFEFTGAKIDSRAIAPGEIFIALPGEKCDGNDFIEDACQRGAGFVVCNRKPKNINVPYLVVDNPLQALTMMAQIHRETITCPIIAVTGSNGKTTVKEMIINILPQPSCATYGNFNNHIGVPLSILQLNSSHKFAVFELGANHVGEIAHTVSLVKPDVAIINNIAPAHLAAFGSLEKIVQAKGEIYAGLKAGGCAVVNDDDHYAHAWDELYGDKKVLRYSDLHVCDVMASD